MTTNSCEICYKNVKKEVMQFHYSSIVRIEKGDANIESFLGFISVLFWQEGDAVEKHSIDNLSFQCHSSISVILSGWWKQCLIGNVYMLIRFIPVCCSDQHRKEERSGEYEELSLYYFRLLMTMPLESVEYVLADLVERQKRMRTLHKAMKVLVTPLHESKLKGLLVPPKVLTERRRVLILVL